MALKAKGAAALDCFEVTLKCEEGDDDDEAVVVAVIPRPEPMLRGEGGDTSLPLGGPGLDLQVPVPGSRSPGASLGRHLQPQRLFCRTSVHHSGHQDSHPQRQPRPWLFLL